MPMYCVQDIHYIICHDYMICFRDRFCASGAEDCRLGTDAGRGLN